MPYKLSARSRNRLTGVHPDLIRVVTQAILLTDCDFVIVEGVRTMARQRYLYSIGKSTTMNSRHLTGHAVDLAPWVNDSINWLDCSAFNALARAMKLAGEVAGVAIEWGGDWSTFVDRPHHQLGWQAYPA